jgi:hypothetical protein
MQRHNDEFVDFQITPRILIDGARPTIQRYVEPELRRLWVAQHLIVDYLAQLGDFLAVEPLRDPVEITAYGRRIAGGVPRFPPMGELLIDFGAPLATTALGFTTVVGLESFADLRTPAGGRIELLEVSRYTNTDEEGIAAFEQAVAERFPGGRGHLVGISGGKTLANPDT